MKKLIAVIMMLALFCASAEGLSPLESVIGKAAKDVISLACDKTYMAMMGTDGDVTKAASAFAALDGMQPVNMFELKNVGTMLENVLSEVPDLSDAAVRQTKQRMYSGSFIASLVNSRMGVYTLAATSMLVFSSMYSLDLPSCVYVIEYENDMGVVVGIWNNGEGINIVNAALVSSVSLLKNDSQLSSMLVG